MKNILITAFAALTATAETKIPTPTSDEIANSLLRINPSGQLDLRFERQKTPDTPTTLNNLSIPSTLYQSTNTKPILPRASRDLLVFSACTAGLLLLRRNRHRIPAET